MDGGNTCNTGGVQISGADGPTGVTVDFSVDAGRASSVLSYVNVEEVSVVLDLAGLTHKEKVNAAFYFIATDKTTYCDSGGNGNCGEIDFLETNGNGIFQTTIHSDWGKSGGNPQSFEYSWTGNTENGNFHAPTPDTCYDDSHNSCYVNGKLRAGLHDISALSNSIMYGEVKLVAKFFRDGNGAYTRMTVTLSEVDGSNPQTMFDSSVAPDPDVETSQIDWSRVTADMQKGQALVVSYWQGYSPGNNGMVKPWFTQSAASSLCNYPNPTGGPTFKQMTVSAERSETRQAPPPPPPIAPGKEGTCNVNTDCSWAAGGASCHGDCQTNNIYYTTCCFRASNPSCVDYCTTN